MICTCKMIYLKWTKKKNENFQSKKPHEQRRSRSRRPCSVMYITILLYVIIQWHVRDGRPCSVQCENAISLHDDSADVSRC